MRKLESVGCYVDETKGITYPIKSDDKPDFMADVFIEDCSYEWFKALSIKDKLIVKKIIDQI